MSRRTNEKFYNEYLALDALLAGRLGLKRGGVTEYINRLGSNTSVPNRDATLKKLVHYRGIRNKMAHEADALRKLEGVTGEDIKWVKSFAKDVTKGRDPLSRYLKKPKRSPVGLIAAALIIAAVVAVVIFIFK